MAITLHYMQCCGIKEINGLKDSLLPPKRTPREVVEDIAFLLSGVKCAFLLFSGHDAPNWGEYGHRLRDFILANDLGTIIETEAVENPNSCNKIRVWIWTLNRPVLNTYFKPRPTHMSKQTHYPNYVWKITALEPGEVDTNLPRADCNCRTCVERRRMGMPSLMEGRTNGGETVAGPTA